MLVFRQRSNKSTKYLLDNLSNALAFQHKTPGFHLCDTFSFTSVVINSFGSLALRHQAHTELMFSCGRLRLVNRNIPAQAGRWQKWMWKQPVAPPPRLPVSPAFSRTAEIMKLTGIILQELSATELSDLQIYQRWDNPVWTIYHMHISEPECHLGGRGAVTEAQQNPYISNSYYCIQIRTRAEGLYLCLDSSFPMRPCSWWKAANAPIKMNPTLQIIQRKLRSLTLVSRTMIVSLFFNNYRPFYWE